MIPKNIISVVFCLLARNCVGNLQRNISFIEKYRKQFNRSIVIIVENDSIDGTKEILEKWGLESEGIIVQNQNHPEWETMDRITRIAHCRNEYMNILRLQNTIYDFVIIIDMDLELCNIDFMKVIDKAPSDFSALFANGRYYKSFLNYRIPVFYYDLYAYIPFNSSIIEFKKKEIRDNGDALEKRLRKEKYVPCDSAFGGLAIYRTEAIQNLFYAIVPNHRSDYYSVLCEHIPFNLNCKKQGSLYIVKDMHLFYEPLTWEQIMRRYLCRFESKRCFSILYKLYCIFKKP